MSTNERSATEPASPTPIRVTVVGGYLGSGKTTLVNSVLKRADERIAVLVNDFGEVNIDAALIDGDGDGDDGDDDKGVVRLANGCICCSMADGLASALTTIGTYEPRPERLLIEASGVSEPASVAAYGYMPGFSVDGVVVVADAVSVQRQSRDRYVGDTIVLQLAAADIIVLNKASSVDADQLVTTRQWLADKWPNVSVVNADYGEVPLDVLFDITPLDHHHAHVHDHASPHATFETWTLRRDEPMARAAFDTMMDELPTAVVRAKGFVRFVGDDQTYLLQRVGTRWTIEPTDRATEDGTVIVLIGETDAVDKAWLDRF